MGKPAPEIRDEVRVPAASGEELSEEEIAKIRKEGLKLLNDAHVHGACINLVIARQLYNVALQSLNRRMDELAVEQTIERFLIEAMKHKSTQEFTREEVAERLAQATLPWMAAEVSEAKERENAIVRKEMEEAEQDRRKHLIPLDFRPGKNWELLEGQAYLGRERTLSIAGPPQAVRFVLDRIMGRALLQKETPTRPKPTVLRAMLEVKNHNVAINKDQREPFYTVGSNRWLHCGRSLKAVEDTFKPFIGFLSKEWVDLMIVDDLSQGVEATANSLPWFDAGRCQRHFRKWADKYGAALVVGIPVQQPGQKVDQCWDGVKLDSKWSQLETYTDLVQLRVLKVPDNKFQINAMQHLDPTTEIELVTVDRELLGE